MDKVIIWHNTRCRKSRAGLQFLRDRGIDPEVFEYLKEEIDPKKLAEIINMSSQPLGAFVRKNEKEFKELGLKEKNLSVNQFSQIASGHPKILERPIVIKGKKSVVARPAELIDEILQGK